MTRRRLDDSRGQSVVEFAVTLPLLVTLALGVIETSYALLDQHIVTKLTREGSNLISRDSTLEEAATAMRKLSIRPVNFDDGSRLIFSVIRKGATVGTANFDKEFLYQRYEFGSLAGFASTLETRGAAAFRGAPNYEAVNPDTDVNLQITNLPESLVVLRGGMVYVTEVYTRHELITPFDRLGITLPETLYSIAYF
jgi:hypothetical protein